MTNYSHSTHFAHIHELFSLANLSFVSLNRRSPDTEPKKVEEKLLLFSVT